MNPELHIYANHEVARRYQQKMDRSGLVSLAIAVALGSAGMYCNVRWLFYFFPGIFLVLAALSFLSKDSMLNDADNGKLMFRFTPEGWYRNESLVLYRWEDFKRVEFLDRAITFHEAKQHKIHSSTISPMLMTDTDFDKAERWIREHLPEQMRP